MTASPQLALARTLYGEARNQGREGMKAVANVVMNRVADPRWPDSVTGVVKQSWEGVYQFSTWDPDDPNRAKIEDLQPGANPTFDLAYRIAGDALTGLADRTGGATHYHADYVEPGWAAELRRTGKIGDHIFYA